MTFKHSTQTEATFYVGSPATGIYDVVRNYANIGKTKLEKITGRRHPRIARARPP